VVALAGCGDTEAAAEGGVPASASRAPADALAFATVVTDESSTQWQRAESLLARFPGARQGLLDGVQSAFESEGIDWDVDVAPALGPELVVVVLPDERLVMLTEPDDEVKLADLLARSDESPVSEEVDGWTAVAESATDLDAYRAALARGTLEADPAFVTAMEGLPTDSLARGWIDLTLVADEVSGALEGVGAESDISLDSLALAASAQEDGLLLVVGARLPEGTGDTSYDPELFDRVPADAVAALSFGGTQGTLDAVQGQIDLDALAEQVEEAVGVSLDGVFDALSGEGVLYLRDGGGDVPEVTLALRPPDAGDAFDTVDRLVRKLAAEMGEAVVAGTQDGSPVSELRTPDVTISYARLDDLVVVTTGGEALAELTGDGDKLADSKAFTSAAERAGLDGPTQGFLYVDVDGLIPFVEGLGGPDAVPAEVRDALTEIDAIVLQAEGDGETTLLQGFVRVPG
jgi:hypothetical protein